MTNRIAMASVLVLWGTGQAPSQVTQTIEKGADGITYQVTRQVVQSTVPVTEYKTQQQQVYAPQAATGYQTYQQTYAVPVTEYRMVSRLRGWWNPFAEPYWTHELQPVTRWDYRAATVQIPTTSTNWVTQTQEVQVPITTYKTVQNEYTSRVAINGTGAGVPAAVPAPGRVQDLTPAVEPKVPVVASRPETTGISGGRYSAAAAPGSAYRNLDRSTVDRYGGEQLPSDPPREPSRMR